MRTRTMHRAAVLCCLAGLSLTCGLSGASAQLKPYILVVVDTSTSMGGNPATNSCGYEATRMGAARCALSRIVNAAGGDVDFGLMQFAQPSDGMGGFMCGFGGACGTTSASAWMRQPITTNTSSLLLSLVDGIGTGPGEELCSGGYTPLGGTLVGAREYFQSSSSPSVGDSAIECRPYAVVLLTDGVECCSGCSWVGDGCPKAKAVHGDVDCADGCSSVDDCTNNHFETAPERAHELAHETLVPSGAGDDCNLMTPPGGCGPKEIKTYPIGFGIAPPNDRIERIAITGHTNAPGGNRGFYAENEAELSAALSQIIADAQPPPEECNNADDDCDGEIDEGITKFCDLPNGIEEQELCEEPDETNCDGIDDDCDGLVDEGLLNACGACDADQEICDDGDNDCDGRIDEDIDGLGQCGTDVGICEFGELRCIDGEIVCRGGKEGEDETCNCEDDDCDGFVDEAAEDSLCEDEAEVCLGCECAPPCGRTQEFEPTCADDRLRPEIQENGACVCVEDTCDTEDCRASEIVRGDELVCAPADDEVGSCVCKAGNCVARCDGVGCDSDEVCDKRTGRCVEDNCRGLGCEDGELCDPLGGECLADPCPEGACADDEVCREGACEPSCANARCDSGQRCVKGECVDDLCADDECTGSDVCDPEDGSCRANGCLGVACASGLVCDRLSGDCVRDPCFALRCPEGQKCGGGECTFVNIQGRPQTEEDRERVLAAGGGGCACRVGGRPAGGGPMAAALALLLGVALVWRRGARGGSRHRGLLALGIGALLAFLAGSSSGCSVEPFCINCTDGAVLIDGGGIVPPPPSSMDGGSDPPPSMRDGGDDPTDGSTQDAPSCVPDNEECNGRDDDCDFIVDEDAPTDDKDCLTRGVCEGTAAVCVSGALVCRYPEPWEADETLCDGEDNDCDGAVDEAHDDLGETCEVGAGACANQGLFVCDSSGMGLRCDAEPREPGDEVCDGRDNDCDGLIDEPKSEPGSHESFVQDRVVQVGSSLWVYRFEASRPDASEDAQGIVANRACSRRGVLPWTNVTLDDARAACQAADMDVCTLDQWLTACEAGQGCGWGYTPASGTCNDYEANGAIGCNGHDIGASPGSADNDAMAPTGAFEECYADHPEGPVFDISGNAKEWAREPMGDATRTPLRGGSYSSLPGGMRCDFDFSIADAALRLANVGFRCCSDSDPIE